MVTKLTDGYFYILDSDAYSGGTPDLDGLTEGTHYCKIAFGKGWSHTMIGKPKIRQLFGGKGYFIKDGKMTEKITFTGKIEGRTAANYIMNYYKKHIVSGSRNDYVFIPYTADTDYWDFHDEDDDPQNGAPGVFTKCTMTWTDEDPKIYDARLEFEIVW